MKNRVLLNQLGRKSQKNIRWSSHVALHRAIVKSFPVTGILELGAGLNSTKEFFNTDKRVVSIENDGIWIKKLRDILVENDLHKIIHHILLDSSVKRGTSYTVISKETKDAAISFYNGFIIKELNMLFIDNYAGLRIDALQSLYSKFDIVTFHDAEDPRTYGYNLFKNEAGYIRFTDKTFIAHTGLLIRPNLNQYVDKFLENFKIEAEKMAVELNIIAPVNIIKV